MFTDKEFRKNQSIRRKFLKKLYQAWLVLKVRRRAAGYLNEDLKAADSAQLDCVFVQRDIVPRLHSGKVCEKLGKLAEKIRILWDFDDDIIGNGEIPAQEMKLLTEKCDRIIVTHEHLKDKLPEEARSKVCLLPTTDLQLLKVFRDKNYKKLRESFEKEIRLIWIGSSANLGELEKILPVLDEVAEGNKKKLTLSVVCNRRPEYECRSLEVSFTEWSRQGALEELKKAHIGIMPLTDSEFSRGKGAFKLIQYMGAGIPVIGSAVGFNAQVIGSEYGYLASADSEWRKAITELSGDKDLWENKAKNARREFEDKYNPENNIKVLEELING